MDGGLRDDDAERVHFHLDRDTGLPHRKPERRLIVSNRGGVELALLFEEAELHRRILDRGRRACAQMLEVLGRETKHFAELTQIAVGGKLWGSSLDQDRRMSMQQLPRNTCRVPIDVHVSCVVEFLAHGRSLSSSWLSDVCCERSRIVVRPTSLALRAEGILEPAE